MIDAKQAMIWTNPETHQVRVIAKGDDRSEMRKYPWGDVLGASVFSWQDELDDKQRVDLMLETAIDLAARGFNMAEILREFAKVKQFRALGNESQPMCRALTQALIGKTLDLGGSMSFDEIIQHYGFEEDGLNLRPR